MAKNINKTKMVLFEGTEAHFSLSVEAHFTRAKADGSIGNLVYVSDNGVANLNPNIYLIFAYKGDTYEESKSIFTSFPQLHKIRKALRDLAAIMEHPEAFMTVDGALVVRPEFNSAFTVSNIGQNQNWISFSPVVAGDANGMVSRAVQIRFSGTEFASILSEDEFFTIVEILNDLDLASIKASLSSFVVLNNNDIYTPVVQPQYYGAQQAQPTYAPRYQAPAGRTAAPGNPQPQMGRSAQAPTYQRTGRQPYASTPVANSAPVQQNTQFTPPANTTRESNGPSAPIVNMNSIEAEAPTFSLNYSDPNEDMINSIFGD